MRKNQDEFGVSCLRVNPEVNDLNFDEISILQYHNAMNINNKGSTVNEESSINTSDMMENILVPQYIKIINWYLRTEGTRLKTYTN